MKSLKWGFLGALVFSLIASFFVIDLIDIETVAKNILILVIVMTIPFTVLIFVLQNHGFELYKSFVEGSFIKKLMILALLLALIRIKFFSK